MATQLSGAAKRKLAKQRREDERARAAGRIATGGPIVGPSIERVGPAPIGDSIAAMLWCNNVLLACMERVLSLTDAEMPLEQRLRFLIDGCAKAGMIRDKTAEANAMMVALRRKAAQQEAAGLEPNLLKSPPPLIQRPA